MKTRNGIYRRLIILLLSLALMLSFIPVSYAYSSITNRENAVTVDVKPEQIIVGKPIKFTIRLNTHSVDLAFDMVSVSVLKDDNGKTYQPVSWKGSPIGGHHRNGTLEFPKLEGNPKSVTLVIKNISNVPERIFQWDIE